MLPLEELYSGGDSAAEIQVKPYCGRGGGLATRTRVRDERSERMPFS